MAIFFLCLVVRLLRLPSLSCPLPVDAAYYYSVAENLHHGRGFVIDYVWNYLHGLPQSLPVASNDYWQPLVSIILAMVFAVAPVCWETAQVTTAFFGSFGGVLAFWFAWRLSGRLLLGLVAGIYIAFLPEAVFASYTTDTPAFFAVFAGAALISVVLAVKEYGATEAAPGPASGRERRVLRYFLAAGGLSALACLVRFDGALILLTGTLAVVWLSRRQCERTRGLEPPASFPWQPLLAMWGTFLVLISPWLVRNYLAFGSPLAGGFVKSMLIAKYADLFTSQPEKLTLTYYLSHGTSYNLFLKLLTLGHCMRSLAATYGAPVLGLWLWELCAGRRTGTHLLVLFHFVLILCLTSLVLTLVALKGTFHHMTPVLLPLVPAFAILGVQRFWRKVRLAKFLDYRWGAAVLFLGLSTLSGLSMFPAGSGKDGYCERRMRLQRDIASYLEQKGAGNKPIFTDNAWHYYYFNHKPAYSIPIDPYSRIKEVARTLGVEYLVVSPGALPRFPDLYEKAEEDRSLVLLAVVYAFQQLPNSDFAAGLPKEELENTWAAIEASLAEAGTSAKQTEMTMVFQFLDPEITGRTLSSHEVGRLHHRSGRMLAIVGQFEQALVSFQKAVECAPDVPDTYYNLARALFEFGKELAEETKRPPTLVGQFQKALLNAEKARQMAPERKEFAGLVAEIRAKIKSY